MELKFHDTYNIEGNGPMQELTPEQIKEEEHKRANVLGIVLIGDVEKSVNRRQKLQKKKSYLRQSARLSQK